EVVEKRPGEVATHRRAPGDRPPHRLEVRGVIGDALTVLDPPAGGRRVVICGATLGDHDLERRRRRGEAQEARLETLGVDRPAERGERVDVGPDDVRPEY